MTEIELGGRATGIGSMPGTDIGEAARMVFGELGELPHMPELPGRGLGADIIGRTAAMLVDLPTEVVPSGYRVAAHYGRDARRGMDLLERDLDTVHELELTPPAVKVQVAGPWTLTAGIELMRGSRVLTDQGALREFTESLIEGLRLHIAEVARRTGAPVVVQLDEPTLPWVLIGGLRTPSGYGHEPAVPGPEVTRVLSEVIEAARAASGQPVIVHCCAQLSGELATPISLLRKAGADGIALDVTGFNGAPASAIDQLGEAIEEGTRLLLGVVPSTEPSVPLTLHELAKPALDLVDRLGFPRTLLATAMAVTPTCGLSAANMDWAHKALSHCTELTRAFAEPPESW